MILNHESRYNLGIQKNQPFLLLEVEISIHVTGKVGSGAKPVESCKRKIHLVSRGLSSVILILPDKLRRGNLTTSSIRVVFELASTILQQQQQSLTTMASLSQPVTEMETPVETKINATAPKLDYDSSDLSDAPDSVDELMVDLKEEQVEEGATGVRIYASDLLRMTDNDFNRSL